jgi:hypothetical protein
MLYSVSRDTPEQGIEKVAKEQMISIAQRLELCGIPWEVFE